jgi:hypothetical protein
VTEDERRLRLEKALAYGGTHDLADLAAMVHKGEAQWWGDGDGMIVTEIHTYPKLKALSYWLIAGELGACLSMEDEINAWGIEQGCTVAVSTGRKGWVRAAAKTGWKPRPHMFPVWKPLVNKNE